MDIELCQELEIANKERAKNYKRQLEFDTTRGIPIYKEFCVWCMAFNGGKGQKDGNLFAQFLSVMGYHLTYYQRYYLLKNYFGYNNIKREALEGNYNG